MIVVWLFIALIIVVVVCFTLKIGQGNNGVIPPTPNGWIRPNCPIAVATRPASCNNTGEFQDNFTNISPQSWQTCTVTWGAPFGGYPQLFCNMGVSYEDVSQLTTSNGMWFYQGQPLYVGYNYSCDVMPCTQDRECLDCYKTSPDSPYMGADDDGAVAVVRNMYAYKKLKGV